MEEGEGEGARWVISRELLERRDVFPPDEPVRIRVTTTLKNEDDFTTSGSVGSVNFTTEVGVRFLHSPVVMILNSNMIGTIFYEGEEEGEREGEEEGGGEGGREGGSEGRGEGEWNRERRVKKTKRGGKTIFLDFGGSFTEDGVVVGEREGEWEWEWDWRCLTPRRWGEGEGREEEGEDCIYEGGKVIIMPGRGEERFQGEEGERLREGVPLFFSVKARVRKGGRGGGEGEGRVVAEGRWSGVVNPVRGGGGGLELIENYWICEDSSIGYLVFFVF